MAEKRTKRGCVIDEKARAEVATGLWRVPLRNSMAMPFELVDPGIEPNRGDDDQGMPGARNFLWSDEISHVLDCALEEGLVLKVPVTPEQAVPATAALVQNLCRNVWCAHDRKAGCVLLWDHDPHDVEEVKRRVRHDNGTAEGE